MKQFLRRDATKHVPSIRYISCAALIFIALVLVNAQEADKPVEQVRKNIQVLKGLPSSELLPVMHFMRTSLGVRCELPNKFLAVLTTPEGVTYQGFNGTVGWIKSPVEERQMTPTELARLQRQTDLYDNLKLKERYVKVAVTGRERLGDREVYVVDARSTANKAGRSEIRSAGW